MDELVGRITTLLDAFAKRGDRRASAGRALIAALSARTKPPPPASAVVAPPPDSAAEPPAVVPPRSLRAVAVPSPEAGLVTGLFASPASLVAAFIVAEILAKPVALRDR